MSPVQPDISQPDFFSKQVRHAKRFYRDLTTDQQEGTSVVCGGREVCLPEYEVERASFPYFSLEFVSGGRGTLELAGETFTLTPGTAYTYGPDVAHRIMSDSEHPLEKYFVDFTGKGVSRLLHSLHFLPGSVVQVSLQANAQRAIDELVQHGARNSEASFRLCDSLLQYILLLISSTAVAPAASLSPAYASYVRCRDYMQENYLELHCLKDAAQAVSLDKTYLCHLFQRFDSQTPHEYLTRLKMNKAAELLEDTELLIKQVASTVGYADAFHFSRVFKRVLGVSPKHFRLLRTQVGK